MYGEYHILSSRLLLIILREYDKAHLTHLLLEEVVGPRDICQEVFTAIFPSGVWQQLFESSSIKTGHHVLYEDVDPKRLGYENNAKKEAQRATINIKLRYRHHHFTSISGQIRFSIDQSYRLPLFARPECK